MPDYGFYTKGKQTVVLRRSEQNRAAALLKQGFEKQPEEVYATDENQALARLRDIQQERRIDQHNLLTGAFAMPLIGVLVSLAASLFWRKRR